MIWSMQASPFSFSLRPLSLLCSGSCVAGFQDAASVCEPVQESGCYLCITEDLCPFTEAEVSGDDHVGALVELA